jgi:hypothetical protein
MDSLYGYQLRTGTVAHFPERHNVKCTEVAATSASSFEADDKVKRETIAEKFC